MRDQSQVFYNQGQREKGLIIYIPKIEYKFGIGGWAGHSFLLKQCSHENIFIMFWHVDFQRSSGIPYFRHEGDSQIREEWWKWVACGREE